MPKGVRNIVVLLAVVAVVAGVAWYKERGGEADDAGIEAGPARVPRMVDLGADKCIPCKKMAPILEELRVEYAGRAEIEFIDVWKNPSAGELFGIRSIPTQVFYDRHGREVWRHEGFLSKEDIEAKLKELGA